MNSKLPERIFLCGFMGAGKSTIGQKLAARMEVPFLDLDHEIEKSAGSPIPEIFKERGEESFRTMERQALVKVSRDFKGIVALGGGSLQDSHITAYIKQKGVLIFIEVPLPDILDRIAGDENRPLLVNEHGEGKSRRRIQKEISALYQKRLRYYEQADVKLTGHSGQSSDLVAEQLLTKINNHVAH